MTSIQATVSRTINSRLAFVGKTKVDLAEALGMKRSSVWYRMSGKKSWGLDELDKIAKFLGLKSAWELLSIAESEASTKQSLVA